MDEIDQTFGMGLEDSVRKEVAPAGATPASPPVLGGAEEIPTTTPMTSLASYVMARFQENSDFRDRSGVSDRLDYCIRAQKCEFTKDQKEKLERVLSPDVAKRVFAPITSVKNRAARSMLIDLVNQSGDPLFHLEPTPVPETSQDVVEKAYASVGQDINALFSQLEQSGVQELPEEAMARLVDLVKNSVSDRYDDVRNIIDNEARVRAKRMEKKVWDCLVEGGWNTAFEEYIDYICTYGTGVIVGPIVRNVAKNTCTTDKKGVKKYRRVLRPIPTYEAVSPMDCFPAPDAKDVEDGAFCITVKYTADELWRFAENAEGKTSHDGEGWMDDTVRALLARHPRGGVKISIRQFSADRRFCENNGYEDTADCTFEGVRCFASVRGSELVSMGILKNRDRKPIEINSFYRTETIVIDNRVVYCRIYPNEMEVPISKGVFYTLPGSWWGEAIADKVAMCQCVLNNCIRALLSNMSASSGAIYWINDVQRLANKSLAATKLKAGMTIPFLTSMIGNSGAPIGSVTVPSNASELIAVWRQMQTQADYDSGLPAYTEGQSAGSGGALRTAQGLAMFTEASTRGLKMVMTTTDRQVITKVARLTADWVLLNDDDMDLKGDVEVRSVGLIGKILKVQRDQNRLQLLNLCLNSQLLNQAIGIKGIMQMFRPSLQDLDINPDDVIPSEGKLAELEAIQSIQQIFQATQASQGIQQAGAEAEASGMQSGIAPIEQPQGAVDDRRGVA